MSVISHLSHVGQVGWSYGILPVPLTPSILCVCPIQSITRRTSGTVLWNSTFPTNTLNPLCPSYPTYSGTDESYLSHQHTPSFVCVLFHLSHVGQVGRSYGILPVPLTHSILYVRPIPPVPCRNKWDGPMEILPVPLTQSILCVRHIPPVPCRTSGTVLWNPTFPTNTLNPLCPSYPTFPMYSRTNGTVLRNPTCPTNILNPMCLSYPTCPMYLGQVGQSHGILHFPPTHSILCVRPIPLFPCTVGQVGRSYGILLVPLTYSILCVSP